MERSDFPTISRFFTWWFGELRYFLPGRGIAANTARRLFVAEAHREKLVIAAESGGDRRQTIELELNGKAADTSTAVFGDLRKLARRSQRKTLAFSPELVLHRKLKLPAAARENLREVLGFEMDRYTPFEADKVFYNFKITDDDVREDGLQIDLFVIPKYVAQPYLDRLSALDIEIDDFGVLDAGGGLDPVRIAPGNSDERSHRLPNVFNLVLLGVLFGCLGAAVYLDIERTRRDIDQLRVELAKSRQQAQQAIALRDRVETTVAQMMTPLERKANQQSMVALLDLISGTLPDRTYLQRFDVRQNRLTLTGYSDNASSLIDRLEKTGTLANVQFVSPVTFDARVGRDRFNIRADLVIVKAQDE